MKLLLCGSLLADMHCLLGSFLVQSSWKFTCDPSVMQYMYATIHDLDAAQYGMKLI